jgi:hypothetical protein
MSDDEDRAGGRFDDPLGHAADVGALKSVATYLADDDQVSSRFACQFSDFSMGDAMPDRLVSL